MLFNHIFEFKNNLSFEKLTEKLSTFSKDFLCAFERLKEDSFKPGTLLLGKKVA